MSNQPLTAPPTHGQPTQAHGLADVATTASQSETSRPPSHNGSTSSSNTNTPRSSSTEPGPTLWVEMWENQRWFPVIGWGTSRFQQDLPTFCCVPPGYRLCGSHPDDFDAAFNAANPPPRDAANPHFPAQSIVQLRTPHGYRWVGYWEICKQHRHGTDVGGWRYAEQFFVSDGHSGYRSDILSPFKKTHTSLCVVRRRVWRRRVAVLTGDEVAAAYNDMYMTDDDMQTQTYLIDMEEEMKVAEGFKSAEAQAARAGTPWTREQELKAEEELRKFCRQRRSRESATRMRSSNPSFVNPFHYDSDTYQISPTQHNRDSPHSAEDAEAAGAEAAHSGAMAATSWVRARQPESSPHNASTTETSSNTADMEPQDDSVWFHSSSSTKPSRVDGDDVGPESRVNRFVSESPTDSPALRPDAGDLLVQNIVNSFVVSTPVDETENTTSPDGDCAAVLVGGIKSPTGAEFRAIFSQFMAPEGKKRD